MPLLRWFFAHWCDASAITWNEAFDWSDYGILICRGKQHATSDELRRHL